MKKTIIKQLTNLSDFFVSGCCFGMSSEFKIPEKLKKIIRQLCYNLVKINGSCTLCFYGP